MSGSGALLGNSVKPNSAAETGYPLAVDLNGTLISIDTLHEGFVAIVRRTPLHGAKLLSAIRHGKPRFKREIAQGSPIDPAHLPYNAGVLEFLNEQKRRGRKIGLFTAADQSIAQAVADHLGLFDVVRGSDNTINLSGTHKLAAIHEAFGPHFAYAGNAAVDRPIFAAAASVLLVGDVSELQKCIPSTTPIEATFPLIRWQPGVWARALRLEHWAKNTLVFVAPILGLEITSTLVLGQVALLFGLMGLLASATYLVNDAFDLIADRQHSLKRLRPMAAGVIPVRDGLAVSAGLIALALTLSLALPLLCTLSLLAYLVLTLAYSFALKREPIVDVFVLAALFTVRIVAGGVLIMGPISPWLLTFSMLFFLGLAFVKRYAELERVVRTGGDGVISRGYTAADLPLILVTGVGSGLGAVVIFTVYLINEHYPQVIYRHPEALWAMMPILLLWTLRIWHKAVHGRMSEDPVVFALKDRFSLLLGALVTVALVVAWS